MMSSPIEVVRRLLANALNEDVVHELVSPTATYVSLCYSNQDLKKIMPYAGVWDSKGPDAIIYTFKTVNTIWKSEAFEIESIFGEGENVAVFGRFTYRSTVLGKAYTSPFAVHAKVQDGKVVYMLFMEDTFGTGATFAKDGKMTYEVEKGKEFEIVAPEA